MSTLRNPVGPQPPKIYWRRRLLVAVGALAVIIIIILIIVRPGSGNEATPTESKSPAAASSAAPSTSAAPADGAACLPSRITLEAVTDKTTYASGQQPSISMKITNTGTNSCSINLGSTQQELIITSGSEKIWDSKDCQTGAVDTQTILKPNTPVATPGIAWDRTRSSTTTCSTTRPAVTAGGASYHLQVKVGDLTSKETAQFILN
jgi:hypothetical protein